MYMYVYVSPELYRQWVNDVDDDENKVDGGTVS